MIASHIGKVFLKAFNDKYSKSYTSKDFFEVEYYPLFFDAEKYMQWVTNSPFVQGIKKGKPPTQDERQDKLRTLTHKISGQNADASIAIGYPSLDVTATTSGQITNLTLPLDEEDVYASWIGSGLGIGIQGGLAILFDIPDMLLDLYDGWKIYRQYLDQTPEMRGNQINTWNGQWISHRYNLRSYHTDDPTASFSGIESSKSGTLEVSTQSWTTIMVGMSYKYASTQVIGYVYNLGQTNTTVGFIPFLLPQIRKPFDLYEKYFGTSHRSQVEHLFGTAFGFARACQMGMIGVQAMEPKGLRDFIEKGKIPSVNLADEDKKINFYTYQIWLLAMLNNEELWESAKQYATHLSQYARSSDKGKTGKSNQVKSVLGANNQKQFLEALTPLAEDASDQKVLIDLAHQVHILPRDNVPYFLTLIRFHFATIK